MNQGFMFGGIWGSERAGALFHVASTRVLLAASFWGKYEQEYGFIFVLWRQSQKNKNIP
jgi:hypothetical protein